MSAFRQAPLRSDTRGFSLIELLVALAIMSVVLMMVMPNVKTYLLDVKISTAVQSFIDGAQLARTEALRRNVPVTLALTNENRGWAVQTGATGAAVTIASKPAESASVLTVTPDKTSITFNSQGLTTETAAVTIKFTPLDANACKKEGGVQRCLNVVVSRGGQVRMCDPAIDTSGDNRKC